MKIAITGASGFLGKSLVLNGIKNNLNIVAVTRKSKEQLYNSINQESSNTYLANLDIATCDLSNTNSLKAVFSACDTVIHLAAAMECQNQYRQTMESTEQLLSALEQSPIKRLILTSSISILDYRKMTALSTIDERANLCMDNGAIGTYARMKRDQELICKRWQEKTKKKLVILRPGLIYNDVILSSAHAGFIKKKIGLVATHEGQVPLVKLSEVTQSLLTLSTYNMRKPCEVFHIIGQIDIHQRDYLLLLRKLKSIIFYIPLNWRLYIRLMDMLRFIFINISNENRLPDSLRTNSVAARQKPFHFSSEKIRRLIDITNKRS